MAYEFVKVEFTPVGKGTDKTPYKADQIKENSWKHSDAEELLKDLLAITDNNFQKVQNICENGVNQYLRFAQAPGADPMVKLLAYAKKNGINPKDLLAKLEATE